MRRVWGLLVGVVGAAATLAGLSGAAQAAPGFSVSPAFAEVSIQAGQPKAQYVLSLRNGTGLDQNFRLSVVDFGSLNEEGGVAFLGTPTSELEHRYGLASWMVLERDAVFVPAGGAADIKVDIANKESLSAGGHYGAVLATAVTETGQAVSDPRVGIKQVLSSLVLVSKAGGTVADLKLAGQTHNGGWWRLPSTTEQRFQNAGNVHLVPRGTVIVKDTLGKVVAKGALNEGSGVILPESFRRYKTPLINLGGAWLPGRYEIVTQFRYDGTEQTKTLTSRFWYAGTILSWALLVAVLLAVAGIFWAWKRGWIAAGWHRLRRPRKRH